MTIYKCQTLSYLERVFYCKKGKGFIIMIYQIKEAIIGFPGNTLLERVSMEIRNTEKIW